MPKPTSNINLPKSWPTIVRSAMLHIVALAQYAAIYTRSWAADSENTRVRLRAERDQLEQEVVLLREEIRIKDARMAALSAHRRPFYPPTQRMAILELRAARGWSLEQVADRFLVCSKTIASWMKRLDESGSGALVQVSVPVNKFPDFARYAVQRLQALCPTLGSISAWMPASLHPSLRRRIEKFALASRKCGCSCPVRRVKSSKIANCRLLSGSASHGRGFTW
jgi:hypothetical protein